ncbi:hypothetical protein TrCOL_g2013 [Triparma columacea]|uniref:Uncharacterized protein n=1 Tax=Triparma columacea TaxID=722753 RepID=A0A9W7L9G8_9STRA|nr:hypothetical protein TrCOL_g2013 [Triparma columacea]
MVYAIVVHHRHKSGHKTLVQGRADLLEFVKSKVEQDKLKDILDPNTGASKVQISNTPLYECFNILEEAGWDLVNGFGAGTADQYVFHKRVT